MKQPEFIVGNWYKTEEYPHYGKFLSYERDILFSSEQIISNIHTRNPNYGFCSGYHWLEVTEEELNKILPDNHPDKIKINMEKQTQAKPFAIFGSKPLLKAIWEDLLSIGYVNNSFKYNPEDNYKNLEYVCTDTTVTPKTIKEFTRLYAGNISSKGTLAQSWEIFELPAQYNDALEFAKKQLSSVYWKKRFEFKVGDYITNDSTTYRNHIGRITKLYTNNIGKPIYNYWGFKPDGEFKEDDDNYCVICPDDRLATDKEIKLFLKRAAKFKGYTDGCKIDQRPAYNGNGIICTLHNVSLINVEYSFNRYNVTISNKGVFSDADNNNDWAKILPNTLPFGNLKFTINKEKQNAKCDMGIITLKEIKSVLDWYEHRPKLLGYTLGFSDNKIGFGCCIGNYTEAKAILKAFD